MPAPRKQLVRDVMERFLVTPIEARDLEYRAKRADMSKSDYIRKKLRLRRSEAAVSEREEEVEE